MHTVSCRDMGYANCEYVASGATSDEAMQNMLTHHKEAHKDEPAKSDTELTDMMRPKVKTS